jgi:hypothetical protein
MIVIDEVPLLLELERRSSLVGTCGNRIPGEVDLDESDRHHGERQVTHRREVFGSGLLRAGWVVGAVAIAYLKIRVYFGNESPNIGLPLLDCCSVASS